VDSLDWIHERIGTALMETNLVGAEAEHEQSARLVAGPDAKPLLRTMLRLRHDLVMIGRAVVVPLPEAFTTRLESPLAHAGVALADYLRGSGAALLAREGPPSFNAVESVLNAYAVEIDSLRGDGFTRSLPGDAAERFFALGFALEQMRFNLKDLERCVAEWAR
jgi:hypothetical protein